MNDTKVQRFSVGVLSTPLTPSDVGRYILHADHARIVAEKDAKNQGLEQDVAIRDDEIARLTTLLAKYQRLHAADVAYDECLEHAVVPLEAVEQRKAAMEAIA